MKPNEKTAQYEHVKKNKNNIAINGSEVWDFPECAKRVAKFPGCGVI